MARYTGPRLKICRQLGVILPGLTSEVRLKREAPPGQHGARRRGKSSDFKERLVEKQKVRFHYGIQEKQFRRYVIEASRQKGPSGRNLITLLESRLDNMIWRTGMAATIPGARQMVVHGHVTVDGKRVDRPSFHVKPNSIIGIREKERSKPFVQAALELAASRVRAGYLDFDPSKASARLVIRPEREDVPFDCNPQAIIEFYSQQI